MTPVLLGWAIWSTKSRRSRRRIYRSKGVAQRYCRDWNGEVPVEVFATHYAQAVTRLTPLVAEVQ